jgi:ADP-heptose:LPS heptosyltransferase
VILLSPWSRKASSQGYWNPKDYPHWREAVKLLAVHGLQVQQVSRSGEPDVAGCALRTDDLPFGAIEDLIRKSDTWMSPDNYFHHLAWSLGKPGVAIFGSSDPIIFGHPENVNLLKGRQYLRARQFGLWSEEQWRPEIFVPPSEVVSAVLRLLEKSGIN